LRPFGDDDNEKRMGRYGDIVHVTTVGGWADRLELIANQV
jgi:hypothetical protein